MHIIPCLKRELQSNLPVREAADRLYRYLDSRYVPWWDTAERDVDSGEPILIRFRLVPVPQERSKYRVSFEPKLIGQIQKQGSGSTILLNMELTGRSKYLLWLWIGSSIVASLKAVPKVLAEPNVQNMVPFVILVLLGLSVSSVMCYQFRKEANALLAEIQKRI